MERLSTRRPALLGFFVAIWMKSTTMAPMRAIGIDMADISYFRRVLSEGNTAFLTATFTAAERSYAEGHVSGDPARHLASHYAAKEAFIKAASQAGGDVFHSAAVDYTDIEVRHAVGGSPFLVLTGKMADLFHQLGMVSTLLTVSHERDLAVAVVVIS